MQELLKKFLTYGVSIGLGIFVIWFLYLTAVFFFPSVPDKLADTLNINKDKIDPNSTTTAPLLEVDDFGNVIINSESDQNLTNENPENVNGNKKSIKNQSFGERVYNMFNDIKFPSPRE